MARKLRRMPKRKAGAATRTVSKETLRQIGVRMVILREALGHSQADWAQRMRIQVPTLSKWENGGRLVNLDILIAICDASGATADFFLRGIVNGGMPPVLVDRLYRHPRARLLRFRTLPAAARAPK